MAGLGGVIVNDEVTYVVRHDVVVAHPAHVLHDDGETSPPVERGGSREPARGEVAELRRVVEEQRGYIEELEGRLARVEDGLDFAERLLAERGAAGGANA